ncbi:hypothetical protein [Xylanimonas protaetiae]|uniref:Uncharacterized protein n=1 Tax=Xylanimonas protaetiae TaxID=2509457 RepID=A0A4P6FKP4_9MICO|nr:hypothetical protein [Xylanimonas protaetiae]QAY71198.1 hypothetical protein ET471_15115 [Xylanimonas protaetiae]
MSARDFSRLVRGATGFLGAYPQIVPVHVGDYFDQNDEGVLVKLGNVLDWPGWRDAVPVESEPVPGSETYYDGCRRVTDVGAGAKAAIPAAPGVSVQATASLTFTRESGFALAYEGATRTRVREIPPVQRRIKELARTGGWNERWILVVEVIEAESATLVVSRESGSSVDLKANTDLPEPLKDVAIADARLGWSASNWRGSGYTSLCAKGTPLFHCVKVRRGLFGRLTTEILGPEDLADVFTDDPFE